MSDLAALLAAVRAAPALPGARCRGRHHLFDEAAPGEDEDTVDQRHAQALQLCAACPALTRCADWFDSLPRSQRPTGVVAGRLNIARPRRKPRQRKATA
jgi:hypothetical protein